MNEKNSFGKKPIPRTPKRNGSEHPKHVNWFPYYAGYNSSFVYDVLKSVGLNAGDAVLDPWNGSGTTTTTAFRMGAKVFGFDINPVMVVAAKSTLLDLGTVPSITPLTNEIVLSASLDKGTPVTSDDPLAEWFNPQSAYALRQLHRSIWHLLVRSGAVPSCTTESISELSTIAAFFLTGLLRTTRSFVMPFVGSNPTWIRSPKFHQQRLRPSIDCVFNRFNQEVAQMTQTLCEAINNGLSQPSHRLEPNIAICASQRLTADDEIADVVLSSPPYLTRIDYAVATKPELATLGVSLDGEFNSLRRTMMGAPAIRKEPSKSLPLTNACRSLLERVRSHPSKGSGNYYYKLFQQYFDDYSRSMLEVSRILKPSGTCVLVVQDSYYKELHIDLARYTTEIAQNSGLKLIERHDFEWNRNMVRVNSRSRRYRTSDAAIESALWFNKI